MDKDKTNKNRVSMATKIWYGAADIYGGGAFNIINFFYAYFLTDVLRISPFWAGVIIPISKIWDAVTDPVMGRITDNTRSRFGRRRIYFLMGIPLIFLSVAMIWFAPNFAGATQRAIYALISYIIFCTVNTMVMVPYQAMMPELSDDYNERTSISGIRMAFSMGSSLLCALLPMMIVGLFPGNVRLGFSMMGIVFGLFFALPWIGTFLNVKEREEFMNAPKVTGSIAKDFIKIFKIKSVRTQIAMFVFSFLALDVISVVFIYMMTYYLKAADMTNLVLGTLIFVQIVSIPLVTYVVKRTSKNFGFKLGSIAWAVLTMATLIITPQMSIVPMFIIAALMGCAASFTVVSVYSIFADVADVGELHFGKRVEGSLSGVQTFSRKVCSAVAIGTIMALLGLAGFVEPNEAGAAIEQSTTVVWTIRIIVSIVPAVLLMLGVFFSKGMKIDKDNQRFVNAYLDKKRNGIELGQEEEKRAMELKKIL